MWSMSITSYFKNYRGRNRKLTPSTPNASSQDPRPWKSPGSDFENLFRAFGAVSEFILEYGLSLNHRLSGYSLLLLIAYCTYSTINGESSHIYWWRHCYYVISATSSLRHIMQTQLNSTKFNWTVSKHVFTISLIHVCKTQLNWTDLRAPSLVLGSRDPVE
jgi:hypothetical protein